MTYGNPHLPLRWYDLRPRLLLEDIEDIVERLRRFYPELVLFPRGLHLHALPVPGYDTVPVRFYANPREYEDDPWLEGGLSPYGLALRVPWPDESASQDPERLIGGRGRYPYKDDRQVYRRFGRVLYLSSGICQEIVHANKSAIADITGVSARDIPDIRYFRYFMSQTSVEFLHDSSDPDMVSFVRHVRLSMRGLTTTTNACYDVITGEPVYAFPVLAESKRWLRRCALEDHLYSGPGARSGNRVLFMGPTPRLLKKWREEAGLPYGKLTNPKEVKTLDRAAMRQRHQAGLNERLPDSIGPRY